MNLGIAVYMLWLIIGIWPVWVVLHMCPVSYACSLKFAYQNFWRSRLRTVQLLWYVCLWLPSDVPQWYALYQYACKNSRRTELRRILWAGFDVADTLIARKAEPVHVYHRTAQRLIRCWCGHCDLHQPPPPRISDVRLPTGFVIDRRVSVVVDSLQLRGVLVTS